MAYILIMQVIFEFQSIFICKNSSKNSQCLGLLFSSQTHKLLAVHTNLLCYWVVPRLIMFILFLFTKCYSQILYLASRNYINTTNLTTSHLTPINKINYNYWNRWHSIKQLFFWWLVGQAWTSPTHVMSRHNLGRQYTYIARVRMNNILFSSFLTYSRWCSWSLWTTASDWYSSSKWN